MTPHTINLRTTTTTTDTDCPTILVDLAVLTVMSAYRHSFTARRLSFAHRVYKQSVLVSEVIVIEKSTEDILVEFLEEPAVEQAAPEFVLELASNTEVSLEIDGLNTPPAALVLEINGLGLPVDVLQFEGGIATIRVPSVGLNEPLLGKLYVLNADMQLVSAVAARLHPGDAG